MSLLRLPRSKFSLAFLAAPAGKNGRVECPCQTVDDFIGVRGSVCGLFLFVQTHAPLTVPPWQSRARKSKFQFHVRRKGADAFRPVLAAGGSLMAYKCLPLCRFRGFTAGFCKNFVQRFQKFKMGFQGKAKNFDLFRMRKKFRVQVERMQFTDSVCALKTQVAIKRQGLPQSGNLAVLCYMLAESGSLPQTYSATLTGRTYTPSAV